MSGYAEYREVNLPWLKTVPAHWEIRRNKNIFTEQKEIVGERSADYTLLSLTLNGIIPRDMDGGGKFPESFDKYKIVKNGDMAFCLFDIDETPRTVGLSGYNGMLTGAYTIMRVSNINARFIYYYYLALDNGKMLRPLYTGLRKTININTFQSTKVPVPPREEQDQIVRFLDWKVSSINKLINIKKKEIKAIDALKRSIISHVITHGLMPDVPMKYSGVKWLGDIPAHWQTIKLKRVTKVRNEKGIYTPNSEDKYIGLENIKGYSNNISITSSEHDVSVQCICHSGDLMFSKLRPYLAKTVIVPYNCFCTGEMMVISAFNGDMRFLRYVMLHERFIDSVNSSTYGAKMPRANSSYILNMQVPIPQVDEQQKIADYIDEKVLQIDMATKKYKQIIDDLQVLKTRLISDTVTGKIDVRGIEIPEYEFVDEDADADNEDDGEEDTEEQED